MKVLLCTCCGAQLKSVPGSNILRCAYCGAEFVMETRAAGPSRSADGLTDIVGPKGVYFRAYVPDGWNAVPFEDVDSLSAGCPARAGFSLKSPDGKGQIVFRSPALWRHYDPGDRRYTKNMLDTMTLTRYRSYLPAADYCDELLSELCPEAKNIEMQCALPPSRERLDDLEKFKRTTSKNLSGTMPGAEFDAELAGKIYRFDTPEGAKRGAVTAMVDYVKRPSMGFFNMFGTGAQMDWECIYEFVLVADADRFEAYFNEYRKMDGTVEEGAYFKALKTEAVNMIRQSQQQTQAYVSSVQNQMARDRANANARISQINSEKAAYISGVQQSVYQNTSNTFDRVAAMQSEAIRGVNSYAGLDGRTVEANVGWDHVYQNASSPENFAAATGSGFDSADYTELRRIR